MRRCPKCNDVFEDDRAFCTNDGTGLIEEHFELPSESMDDDGEEQTVIRAQPIDIRIGQPAPTPTPQQQAQIPLNTAPQNVETHVSPAPTAKKGGCAKYVIVLLIGLIFGGILVGAAGIGVYLYLESEKQKRQEIVQREKELQKKEERLNRGPHEGRGTEVAESSLNGRVIKRSAVLRKSPRNSGERVAELPRNDRLHIIRRRASTSAWYRVKCEHGSTGWMHGNSIAYTK